MNGNKQPKEVTRGSLKIVWAYHAETANSAHIDGLRFSFWENSPSSAKRRKEGNGPQWRCIEPNNPKLKQQVYALALTQTAFQLFLTDLQVRLNNAQNIIDKLSGPEEQLIKTQIQRIPVQINLFQDMCQEAKIDYPSFFLEQS